MDYEKKYNEALERARKIHDEIVNNEVLGFPGQITDIFPELLESEDERMLRTIIRGFENWQSHGNLTFNNTNVDDILAYLEKQKPAEWDEDTKMNLDRALQIIKKTKGNLQGYQSDDGIYECDKAIECLEHFLYRGLEIEKTVEWSEEDKLHLNNAILAAEKEWGSNSCTSRWLKSLRPQIIDSDPLYTIEQVDEKIREAQELSEEDEKIAYTILNLLCTQVTYVTGQGTTSGKQFITYAKERDWFEKRFRSLRPQSSWKPSEEQMGALNYAYCELFKRKDVGHDILGPLQKLIDQLREQM